MSIFKDLTGLKFGKLKVLKRWGSTKHRKVQWLCKCDCGGETIVSSCDLISGHTKSCGCKRYESKNTTHGMKNTRIYSIWCDIKKRCNNPNSKNYKNYGARGINVCNEWNSDFMSFYNWSMNNGYKDNLSIDRINNDKGYSLDNCRWATKREQNNNRRNTVFVDFNGDKLPLSLACEELKVDRNLVFSRMKNLGMTFEEAINAKIPKGTNHYKPINKDSVKEHGLKYKTVWMRINVYGWDVEKALTTPVHHSSSYNL